MKAKFLLMSLFVVLLVSCSSKDMKFEGTTTLSDASMVKAEQKAVETGTTAQPQLDPTQKKIIKDGGISIKTDNMEESRKSIDALLASVGGYYESESLNNERNTLNCYLKARIPAVHFEKFILALEKGKGEVENKNIQARDVTEEYVDMELRLANKQEYLKRYRSLLSKASSVKDILAIEEEIRKLQEEIESFEGRLNFLKDQVAFSTLEINLIKEKAFQFKSVKKGPFWERFKKSMSDGWNILVGFVLVLFALWPFILLTLAVLILLKQIRKRRKIKSAQNAD